MVNLYICCFLIGFIIDKINLFPYLLGLVSGVVICNNSDVYEKIKIPTKQIIEYVGNRMELFYDHAQVELSGNKEKEK